MYQKQAHLAETRRLLAEAGDVLASSLDYETTLSNVASLVVPALADWCVIDIVGEEGKVQRLAVAHQDPGKVKRAREEIDKRELKIALEVDGGINEETAAVAAAAGADVFVAGSAIFHDDDPLAAARRIRQAVA